MNYVIKIEGQEIPVPEEIGTNDDAVKKALAPFFPDAANALITRTKKDDVTTINVVKKAGSKGAALDYLIGCVGGKNPAIEMVETIEKMDLDALVDVEQLLALDKQIAEAVKEGERQNGLMANALKRLEKSRAIPAPAIPMGF